MDGVIWVHSKEPFPDGGKGVWENRRLGTKE